MTTRSAPDVAGPVLGIRVWQLDARPQLHAGGRYGAPRRTRANPAFGELKPLNWPSIPDGWPGWRRLEAACRAQEPGKHTCPDPGCRCGIYAAKTVDQVEALLLFVLANAFRAFANGEGRYDRETWLAAGEVALWGRTIEGTSGYRAQYAYPAALWLLPPAVFGRPDVERAKAVIVDLIRAMRSRYGVSVGYAPLSPAWNAITVRPSIGPFLRWRFDGAGAEVLAEALGDAGLPSNELPRIADALQLHKADLPYGDRFARAVVNDFLSPAFGQVPLRSLGRTQLARYRLDPPLNPATGLPYSQRTVRRHLAILRAAVEKARDRGWFAS